MAFGARHERVSSTLLILWLGGAAGCGAESDAGFVAEEVKCPASTLESGTFPLVHDGLAYSYDVHIPPSYDGSKRTPLVLNIHGLNGTAQEQIVFTKMDVESDAEGFIVVYPTSVDNSWNGGACCATNAPDRDDVGFFRALVSDVASKACIDPKRIYATGMSNGGIMTHRLACDAADLFAAVAPVAGALMLTPCEPSRPIPILHIHGEADQLVPYDLAVSSMQTMAQIDGCGDTPTRTFTQGVAHCDSYPGCKAGVEVTLCGLEGVSHCWPSPDWCYWGPNSSDLIATQFIWDFFSKFTLP